MPDIDVLRPTSTGGNVGWTVTGAASLHAALSDDSDASYGNAAVGVLAINTMGCGTHTPAANHERHRFRGRIRLQTLAGGGFFFVRYFANLIASASSSQIVQDQGGTLAINTFATPWQILPTALASVQVTGNHGTQVLINDVGGREFEAYIDIDCRAQPSFTPEVQDGAGVDQDGSVITDTPRASFVFGTIDYDGLNARSWTLEVRTDPGGVVVYSDSGVGQPPASIQTDPLANGDYEADLQVFSTIRTNDAFGSDVENLTFEIAFVAPASPVLSSTLVPDPPSVDLDWVSDSATATAWDVDADVVTEIERTDCNGTRTFYMERTGVGAAEFIDRFPGLSQDPAFCAEFGQSLVLVGDGIVQTPDSGPLSITGDIDIRVMATLPSWNSFPNGNYHNLVSKWQGGTEESFQFTVRDTGDLWFQWNDGSSSHDVFSDQLPVEAGDQLGVRVTLDVNNGSGGHTVTFYTSTDGVTWTQLGSPIVTAGTTSIDNTAAPLQIGSKNGGDPLIGEIDWIEVRNGINGTVVADPVFTASPWRIGDAAATARTDDAGNTWTLGNSAEIRAETCIVLYRARYWGLVDGVLVSSGWSGFEAEVVDNPTPGNAWVRGGASGDQSVCPDESYVSVRPFGVFQPIGGGNPTVTSGSPGGRDYSLAIAVESEADLVALEAILAQTIIFYQPVGQADIWLAPNVLTAQITKVKRIRTVSIDTVAVNPQPVATPASFFT